MKLRAATRSLIASLEKKSGYPVQLVQDANIPTLSAIRIARGTPAHILTYKPGVDEDAPDYAIAWQCAFASRMYDCPPEKRFLITGSSNGRKTIGDILNVSGGLVEKYRLNRMAAESLQEQLLAGLITHLRSIPVGLRVTDLLTIDYPELLDLEALHVKKELHIGIEVLSPRVREMMPPQVYNPTNYIYAAYALYWAARLENPEVVHPYHTAGFDRQGEQLLEILQSIPDDPRFDYDLIDRWGEYLQIRGWYNWLHYEAP